MFQKLVVEGRTAKVIDVSEKQEVKGRPTGLNTVNLLKVRVVMSLDYYSTKMNLSGYTLYLGEHHILY